MDRNFFTRVMFFIALNYFTARVSCQQSKCLGIHNYCSGIFDMKAVCKGGYCYCSGKDYDYNTCLPDAYGCKIVTDADTALGIPLYTTGTVGKIYSCSPDNSSSQYEVHVLAVYVVPNAGNARVNIISRGKSNRPIVLVLVSYEPVKWILNIPSDITISKIILVSYYILESSISGDVSQVKNIERIGTINSEWSTGYGSDSGGGGTVKTLKQIHKIFGVVTSFTGTYKANKWSLKLSPYNGTADNGTRTATAILPTASPKIRRTKCLGSYCSSWGGMKAFCKDGYCYCDGTYYDYDTCLPDAYGCKIVSNSDTTYTCTPDNSSPLYEVHVLSVYEAINGRPPNAPNARVNIISRGKSNRPIVLVLVSYEPVNWILNIPSDITISKVILVSYYILKSSVSGDIIRVKNIERIGTRNSEWSTGYGSDSGGGGTVKTLKQIHKRFGVVTSFRGTYRTNRWSLELSPFTGNVNSDRYATTAFLPTVSPTVRREKCLGSYCSGQFGDMKAFCKGGYCYCNGKYYDYDTCLPDAYGCKIVSNSDTTYTCTPDNSSPLYEVHVLSVYEAINGRPPNAAKSRVNIISPGKSNRPIVLVLVSYEPVNWILNIPSGITISKVILVSYYIDESSVSGDVSRVKIVERKGTRNSDWNFGYGSDSGGGGTVELLKQIDKRFGVVTSFRGTYRTNRWSLELSRFNGNANVAYCGYEGCKNGGNCIAAFTCRCTPGWTGNTCQNEANNRGNSNSGYDENTKSSESDQNLYYLLFISVPLIIGLGFMADKYLKRRERRTAEHNQPVLNRNVNVNQQYNGRY